MACVCPIYFALQLESTIMGCSFDNKLIALLLILKENPEIDPQISQSQAQFASVYPVKALNALLNMSFRSKVPLIYRNICFTACK